MESDSGLELGAEVGISRTGGTTWVRIRVKFALGNASQGKNWYEAPAGVGCWPQGNVDNRLHLPRRIFSIQM